MIELLMVIMLVAILGAVALPQFLDFRTEGQAAARSQMVQSIATGVKLQKAQAILRCSAGGSSWPPLASVLANDVTSGTGALCTTTQIPNAADRKFIDDGSSISVVSAGGTTSSYNYVASTGTVN